MQGCGVCLTVWQGCGVCLTVRYWEGHAGFLRYVRGGRRSGGPTVYIESFKQIGKGVESVVLVPYERVHLASQ